jgi:hypothetical protein
MKTTAKPEDAVALAAKGAAPYVLPANAPHVIVCAALAIVKL